MNLAMTILAVNGDPLRPGGYAFSFATAAQPATRTFTQIDVFSNRTTPSVATPSTARREGDLNGTDGPI